MLRSIGRGALKPALIFLFYLLFWTLSLPWYADALFVLATLPFLARAGRAEAALALVSMAVALGAVEAAVRISMPDFKLYYREHEKWKRNSSSYEPDITDTVQVEHGDLVAMAPELQDRLAEPRTVRFHTDSRGLRNDEEYHGQKLVLVGDSFVVGNGISQDDLMQTALRQGHGIDSYSIAFPGDSNKYYRSAKKFLRSANSNVSFLFFVFEGNDFFANPPIPGDMLEPNGYDHFRARMRKLFFRSLHYPVMLFNITRRLEQDARGDAETRRQPARVEVFNLGGREVGFLKHYMRMATSAAMVYHDGAVQEVIPHIACVFFVPTKYRTYKPWISGGPDLPDPAPALTALKSFYDPLRVPVVDLTPALRRRAAELLPKGKFVYWRDDTHWNASGIRAAAAVAAQSECLRKANE